MMRALIPLHRWLGVAFCLLFAMWFATGIVMHFVPFPVLTEAERFAGLATLDLARVQHGPAEAVKASGIEGATRVRLVERSDGPLYVVSGPSTAAAFRADDLAAGVVRSDRLALAIANDQARRRNIAAVEPGAARSIPHDQWTLTAGFDAHRPLYRVAFDDDRGTVIYLSSTTGEVVLDTTRRQRLWNYFGSVAHWIYPTPLRSRPATWSALVSGLAFLALVGATIGAIVGVLQVKVALSRPASPYRGVQAWHHWLGLVCAPFVLTWIFSGWLSLDHGWLFSTGEPSAAERAAITGAPAWGALAGEEVKRIGAPVKEVEWFAFDGRIFRRERVGLDQQRLSLAGTLADATMPERAFLRTAEIATAASKLAAACEAPVAIGPDDAYASASVMPSAPVSRLVCGIDWLHVDGASGELLEKLDASRRAYRWFFRGLHTLDFSVLTARPALRAALIVGLCAAGFVFSLTAVAIAWRRLRSSCGFSGNGEAGQHTDAG